MTINPKDAPKDQAFEVTYEGRRLVAQRVAREPHSPWVVITGRWAHVECSDGLVSDLTPLVPARPVTRDDLPEFRSLLNAFTDDDPNNASFGQRLGVSRVMDAVVAHLNERGGVPAKSREWTYEDMPHCIVDWSGEFPSSLELSRGQRENLAKCLNGKLNPSAEKLNEDADVQPKSCCEEARLTGLELARRNEELAEAQDEIAALTKRAEKAEAERDELQRKLDAAEQRPTLDRDTVKDALEPYFDDDDDNLRDDAVEAIMALAPAVPSWLGDVPDRPEVKRTGDGRWSVEGRTYQNGPLPVDMRRAGWDWFAIADHAEAEEAATNDDEARIKEQVSAAAAIIRDRYSSFDPLSAQGIGEALVGAGWTPPADKEAER